MVYLVKIWNLASILDPVGSPSMLTKLESIDARWLENCIIEADSRCTEKCIQNSVTNIFNPNICQQEREREREWIRIESESESKTYQKSPQKSF